MTLGTYVRTWLAISFLLGIESLMLNTYPEFGIIGFFKHIGFFPHMSLNPQPGKSISLFLGWSGFSLMCISNLYSLRKRVFPNLPGKIGTWLDFHIFCGLLGPTLIVFHTNFKIDGLVAISFWSMVISFLSGIIGRYIYLQIVFQKSELEKMYEEYEKKLKAAAKLPVEKLEEIKAKALKLGGAPIEKSNPGVLSSVFFSLWGDLQMSLAFPGLAEKLNRDARVILKNLVITTRKRLFLEQFRQLMGYWHSFHMPFAIFMYAVAIIHIITALLLGVGEVL